MLKYSITSAGISASRLPELPGYSALPHEIRALVCHGRQGIPHFYAKRTPPLPGLPGCCQLPRAFPPAVCQGCQACRDFFAKIATTSSFRLLTSAFQRRGIPPLLREFPPAACQPFVSVAQPAVIPLPIADVLVRAGLLIRPIGPNVEGIGVVFPRADAVVRLPPRIERNVDKSGFPVRRDRFGGRLLHQPLQTLF
jgi:hypothetical protein